MMNQEIKKAIEANIAVHSAMAKEYNKEEPHFRPESIARVKKIVEAINKDKPIDKALDFGCGTGFMINILKEFASEITGVDVTQDMLDQVDKSGEARIDLINADTGTVSLKKGYYDIVTAYTFLDHLYDMKPTFDNAYMSLKSGGVFYADLSPNYYFWESIKGLNKHLTYNSILNREINAVFNKDEEIEVKFGVEKQVFINAEYQKHIKGGLIEEELEKSLNDAGFTKVDFVYHWFIGQAQLINDPNRDRLEALAHADTMHDYLIKSLPLSRNLFKYVGFIARK